MEKQHININIDIDDNIFKKMIFLYNALDKGWNIHKKDNSYIFKKKHQGKQEIFEDAYLSSFIKENCIIDSSFIKEM